MISRAEVPACWSWPPELSTEDEARRRFWEDLGDTSGYSTSALELLEQAAGLTARSDGDRLRIWQAGRCAVCGETDRRMVCDHDHATGLVRGWLCVSCNTREGVAVGPAGTLFAAYRERPPTTILGLRIRYRDPLTRRYVLPEPSKGAGWDATAGLT
ncbi:endonuclease domain-containing protein [Streptomyces anthocyanicus]